MTGQIANRGYLPRMIRKIILTCGLAALIASLAFAAARAAPEQYRLDIARSVVSFTYTLDGTPTSGRIPIVAADMRLDLDNLPASRVNVTLDATRARTGFFIATEAMRGPKVLDTARHPLIRFRSVAIRGSLRRATVTGMLTIRGVTRPMTLDAVLGRQQGTAPTDRDRLIVLLTGTISRAAFGASGYPGLVADPIDLRIVARIDR